MTAFSTQTWVSRFPSGPLPHVPDENLSGLTECGFLQAGCPSYHRAIGVEELNEHSGLTLTIILSLSTTGLVTDRELLHLCWQQQRQQQQQLGIERAQACTR